ncbi:MAG TPA: hypothetical protein VJ654_21030 [Noviherbaspirillum sp.]|nr:hypothetical protein [Noviherbaspirillum sp.]
MPAASLKLTTVFLSILLVACGGGGGGGSTTPANNANSADTSGGSDTSGGTPTPPVPVTPITATVTTAPTAGASLNGTVRLEVRGNSIENVELLPPDGYTPRLGTFTISADKTMAWLDFDTRSLPNGALLARISAFDKPAGSAGATEVIAMATRSWLLRNDPPPAPAQIPAASYMPEVHISSLALPYVDPQPLSAMMALNDTDYDAMLQTEWPRVEGVMHQYIPPNVVLMPPTPLGFSGPWYSCLDFHLRLACREAMNNMIGLMMGKQP